VSMSVLSGASGLKLLVYEALSYLYPVSMSVLSSAMPAASGVSALKLLVYEALSYVMNCHSTDRNE
jgi:hypothetical protein